MDSFRQCILENHLKFRSGFGKFCVACAFEALDTSKDNPVRAASVLATWAASPDAKATTTWVFEQAEDDRPLEAVLRELALAVGSSSASEAMSAIAAPATTVLLGMCESESLSPRVVKFLHRAAAAGGRALVPGALVQLLERVLTSSPHTHATFCDPPCLALWVQLLQQHRGGTSQGTGTDGTALRVFKQLLCMPDRAQQLARGIDVCKFIATLFRIMGAVPGIDSGAPALEVVLRLVQAAEKNGLPTTGSGSASALAAVFGSQDATVALERALAQPRQHHDGSSTAGAPAGPSAAIEVKRMGAWAASLYLGTPNHPLSDMVDSNIGILLLSMLRSNNAVLIEAAADSGLVKCIRDEEFVRKCTLSAVVDAILDAVLATTGSATAGGGSSPGSVAAVKVLRMLEIFAAQRPLPYNTRLAKRLAAVLHGALQSHMDDEAYVPMAAQACLSLAAVIRSMVLQMPACDSIGRHELSDTISSCLRLASAGVQAVQPYLDAVFALASQITSLAADHERHHAAGQAGATTGGPHQGQDPLSNQQQQLVGAIISAVDSLLGTYVGHIGELLGRASTSHLYKVLETLMRLDPSTHPALEAQLPNKLARLHFITCALQLKQTLAASSLARNGGHAQAMARIDAFVTTLTTRLAYISADDYGGSALCLHGHMEPMDLHHALREALVHSPSLPALLAVLREDVAAITRLDTQYLQATTLEPATRAAATVILLTCAVKYGDDTLLHIVRPAVDAVMIAVAEARRRTNNIGLLRALLAFAFYSDTKCSQAQSKVDVLRRKHTRDKFVGFLCQQPVADAWASVVYPAVDPGVAEWAMRHETLTRTFGWAMLQELFHHTMSLRPAPAGRHGSPSTFVSRKLLHSAASLCLEPGVMEGFLRRADMLPHQPGSPAHPVPHEQPHHVLTVLCCIADVWSKQAGHSAQSIASAAATVSDTLAAVFCTRQRPTNQIWGYGLLAAARFRQLAVSAATASATRGNPAQERPIPPQALEIATRCVEHYCADCSLPERPILEYATLLIQAGAEPGAVVGDAFVQQMATRMTTQMPSPAVVGFFAALHSGTFAVEGDAADGGAPSKGEGEGEGEGEAPRQGAARGDIRRKVLAPVLFHADHLVMLINSSDEAVKLGAITLCASLLKHIRGRAHDCSSSSGGGSSSAPTSKGRAESAVRLNTTQVEHYTYLSLFMALQASLVTGLAAVQLVVCDCLEHLLGWLHDANRAAYQAVLSQDFTHILVTHASMTAVQARCVVRFLATLLAHGGQLEALATPRGLGGLIQRGFGAQERAGGKQAGKPDLEYLGVVYRHVSALLGRAGKDNAAAADWRSTSRCIQSMI